MTKLQSLNKRAFFEDIGYRPHAGQWEIHRSNAKRRILACGVRWGKSLCAAVEGLIAALQPCDRSYGWTIAPTLELADKVHREIVVLAAEHLNHRIIGLKEGEKRLILRNMGGGRSEIKAKTADNPTSLLGEGLSWCIIDEAARLKPQIWESHLSQRLVDKDGWALLLSTPRGKNWFYEMFRRGQGLDPDYQSWNAPSWQNPHLNKNLIDDERERLPDRVFKQEFEGQFEEGAGQVFRNIRECATGHWQDPKADCEYYGGLDLARTIDYTVITIINDNREVVFCDRFNRVDWSTQIARIKSAVTKYNNAILNLDASGLGDPIYEALRKEGIHCKPYPFTNKSKSALIDNLTLLFEQNLITIPTYEQWPDGINELESFEYHVSDAGKLRMGAPSSYHDDIVISLALACWHKKASSNGCGVGISSFWGERR